MRKVTISGLKFSLPTADELFHRKIQNYVFEIPNAIEPINGRPRGTLVVIGACFGATTIAGIKLAGYDRAVAFEPDPRNRRLLEINVAANGLSNCVTIVPYAAGAVAATMRMIVASDGNIGGSRVHPDGDQDVEVRRVDDVLATMPYIKDIGLVWCDAQGSEPAVFEGAKSLLTGDVPWGVELAPGLITAPAEAYCDPLQCFDTFHDLRTGEVFERTYLPTVYAHYLTTPSPNNPKKSWHTQLFAYKGSHG